MRCRQIGTILRSKTVAVLPRRAVVVRMVGVEFTLLTVYHVPLNLTILTSHYIMLQFLLP